MKEFYPYPHNDNIEAAKKADTIPMKPPGMHRDNWSAFLNLFPLDPRSSTVEEDRRFVLKKRGKLTQSRVGQSAGPSTPGVSKRG